MCLDTVDLVIDLPKGKNKKSGFGWKYCRMSNKQGYVRLFGKSYKLDKWHRITKKSRRKISTNAYMYGYVNDGEGSTYYPLFHVFTTRQSAVDCAGTRSGVYKVLYRNVVHTGRQFGKVMICEEIKILSNKRKKK